MAVLTFSQEFGSGGTDIAKRVANELGYAFVDKRTIGDLLAQYGLVGFDRVYDSAPSFWEVFDSRMAEQRITTIDMLNKTILALARHDRVAIVGRGSYIVLAGFGDVINIRIQAPFNSRVARVMIERDMGERIRAENAVRESDRMRDQFIESAYGSQRDRVGAFQIALDTDIVPPAKAVRLIVNAAKELEGADKTGRKTVSSIAVEPVLMNAIAELFAA